jgi:hypothetical protein
VFDPRTDMLMSPMSDSDRQIGAYHEWFARFCRCEPTEGYAKPEFTKKTFAPVFYGGHVIPMFSDQSYFAFGVRTGQALVDQVVAVSATQPGAVLPTGAETAIACSWVDRMLGWCVILPIQMGR